MTLLIGLLGPAGAGKSTVAKHLVTKYGARCYSLANPLKAIAHDAFGFNTAQLYGTQEQKEAIDPRYGMSCRQFLQRLGTEGIRKHLGADIWTQTCLRKIAMERPPLAVIEDVRFINEAKLIRDADKTHNLFGYVWRLCPPEDDEARAREKAAGAHASELEWQSAGYDTSLEPGKRGVEELLNLVDRVINLSYPTILEQQPEPRALPQ